MQDYQQRVIDEKKELDEKLTKLRSFIQNSDTYMGLTINERGRLTKQECIMTEYSEVLAERIANFTD